MSSENVEFMNDAFEDDNYGTLSHPKDYAELGSSYYEKKGVSLTRVELFMCGLAAVLLAVVVGLIVHFAQPGVVCRCQSVRLRCPESVNQPYPEPTWEQSVKLAAENQQSLPGVLVDPAAPMAPLTDPGRIEESRLPATWTPSLYQVEIKPDFYGEDPDNFSYEGWVDISLTNTMTSRIITLHTSSMDILNVSVVLDDRDNESISIDKLVEDVDRQFLRIHLDRQMTVGQRVIVRISYSGRIHSAPHGLFADKYYDGDQLRYSLMSEFQPVNARAAFPCLDEPKYRAHFKIILWRKDPMIALSNCDIMRQEQVSDGWYRVHFEKTPQTMSTYLIAFVVGNYGFQEHIAENGLSRKLMRYYTSHSAVAQGQVDYIIKASGVVFDWLEVLFNHTYDMSKYYAITIHDFPSTAMEQWGLTTMREALMQTDMNYTTRYMSQRALGTNSHEMVHMWLGNTVTCSWWNDVWIQEGMARYYQYRAMTVAEPSWHVDQIFGIEVNYLALDADSREDSHPLSALPHATAEHAFDRMSYEKAASLIHMIHTLVLNDSFDEAMREYIEDNKYTTVTHDVLLSYWDRYGDSADLAAPLPDGRTITDIMHPWIRQSGYPVITLSRQGNTFIVTQKHFVLDPERPLLNSEYKWDIPIIYYTENDPTTHVQWFTREADSITLDLPESESVLDQWIVGNYQQRGYYRVNYDNDTWRLLIETLNDGEKRQKIGITERADLIDNSMVLARAGSLDQLIAMKTTRYLGDESAYMPWYAANKAFVFLNSQMHESPSYSEYRAYIRSIVNPLYRSLGWDFPDNEQIVTNYLRDLILRLACTYGIEDCSEQVTSRYERWVATPEDTTILSPEIREIVFSTYIENKGAEAWDRFFEIYQNNWHSGPDSMERLIMAKALTFTNVRWVLDRYFGWAVEGNSQIHEADRLQVIIGIASRPSGKYVAWDYIMQNWDAISNSTRINILKAIADHVTTSFEMDKMKTLFSEHKPYTASEAEAYTSILYTMKANIRWRQQNENKMATWLNDVISLL